MSSRAVKSEDGLHPKLCAVCQAPARNYNFKVLSCDACRAFFRNANQGSIYKTFRCFKESNCVIDIDGRKSCSFCRFKRCLEVGMDISKVRSSKTRSIHLAKKRARSSDGAKSGAKEEAALQQQQQELAAEELYEELLSLTSGDDTATPSIDGKKLKVGCS